MMRAGFLAGGVLRTVIGFILLLCFLASCEQGPPYHNVYPSVLNGSCIRNCPEAVKASAPDCSYSSNSPVCNGTPVQFTGPAEPGYFYHWDFGDGKTSSNQSPLHDYSDPGTYHINLTVTNASGRSNTCKGSVEVKPMPKCGFNLPPFIWAGTAYQFIGPPGAETYYWDFGDGNISTAQSPWHTYWDTKTYLVSLETRKGICWNKCIESVEVKPTPNCSWTSDSNFCEEKVMQFWGPAGMDFYEWDFGDGTIISGPGLSYTEYVYKAAGIYNISLKTTKEGSSKTCSRSVEVKPLPDCSWTSNSPVCNGTPVQFTGPTGMDSWYWDFGDGANSADQSPSHLYKAGGRYWVQLKATQSGLSVRCGGTVIVAAPDCNWNSNSPVCKGVPAQFNATSGMDAYLWDFGDGAGSLDEDPAHIYNAPGTYAVSLKATKSDCSKSCNGSFVVKPLPSDCSWTSNSPVCNGTAVQFTGPTGMDSYQWDFGDGAVSSAQGASHLYSAPGTYQVNLKATKGGCSKSCWGVVVVDALDCSWTSNSPVCNGTSVQFNSPSWMGRYEWDFGDRAVSNSEDPLHLYKAPGTYNVSLKVTRGVCGSKTCKGSVVVKEMPDCNITAPNSVCAGSTGNSASTATSGAAYAWSITNGQITSASNTQSIAFTAGASGTTRLEVTVTAGGCSKKCSKDITVTARPDCTISAPNAVCAGSTGNAASTTASGAAYAWSITNGEITSASNAQSITFTAGASGATGLKVKVTSADGCAKECTKDITVTAEPDCSWSSNAPVCNGTSVQFTGPAGMDSWDWDFGDGGTSTNQSPLHTYASAGVYSVSLKVKKGSCEDTCPGTVEVKEKLDCSWTSNAPVCNGTPVQFTGPAGMDSFQWSFGDGVVSSAKDPAHLYSAPKTYAVSLTVTKGSCSKSCPGTVVVKPQPGDCWTSNSPVCIGTAVVFDAPSGMDKYVWDFDDGARSYEEDPVHLYSAPGKYLVVLTMGKDGHIRSCPGYVVVKSLTDCGMTSHAPAPNGTAAQLAAPSGIGSNPGELGDGRVSSRENRVRIYPG